MEQTNNLLGILFPFKLKSKKVSLYEINSNEYRGSLETEEIITVIGFTEDFLNKKVNHIHDVIIEYKGKHYSVDYDGCRDIQWEEIFVNDNYN